VPCAEWGTASMTSQAEALSIRWRLFGTLFVPAAAVLIAGTVTTYLTLVPPFIDAYDQSLLESALAIAAHVQPDANGRLELSLPPDALAIVRADSKDSVFFRVTSADGTFISGDADLPDVATRARTRLQVDAEYRGMPVRLVGYRTYVGNYGFSVTMGETTHKRDEMRARILTSALATDGVVLGVILTLIWFSVNRSLAPLRALEDQISSRSANDLTPVAVGDVPAEIRGVVAALNRLFGLVREGALSQRRFLDNAAHQLRTPLTGIQAQLELICASEEDPRRRQRLLRILDGARRLGHTTHQLLTLARADESANPRWEFEEVELTAVVESVVEDSVAAAEDAGIDLGAELEQARVRGIGWLLTEALKALTNNALEHTRRGGSVTVRCGVERGAAYIEVVDNGVGIPALERERVLERFFRASNARGSGSGLGLAIVKEVTELHGGALTVDVGPDGAGTRVRLELPVSLVGSAEAAGAQRVARRAAV
jgi:two-component system, OmpR family, sensor histidine kinase TctE